MIIQTISVKDLRAKYLSCKPNDGSLKFDLEELDPSCKFFMVPRGAGRICLKGANGKFVDLHGNDFRCDGIVTGVGFLFSETTLQLDSGKYLSNIVDMNTITASNAATTLEIKSTSFQSFSVNTSLSVPAITYHGDVSIGAADDRLRKSYLMLKSSKETIDITFSIPYSMNGGNGVLQVLLNHMMDKVTGGSVSITLNDAPLTPESSFPTTQFEVQEICCLPLYSLTGENKISIKLPSNYIGTYLFSDAALVFKDRNGILKQENSICALGESSGSSYSNGKLEDHLRRGNPYLALEGGLSWSKITFRVREELLGIGNCVVQIQHRRESGASIDIYLNGEILKYRFDDIPTDSFGISTFTIHSNKLGNINELVIKPNEGKYNISDVNLEVVSLIPDATEENFKRYVKDWILRHRSNIGELSKIPRDDLSAWKFVKEAPYWFFLPFLPISPEEICVLFDYYNMMFVSVAFEIRALNNRARDFHRELMSTDIPRKNALRHAYWTAMLSRRFGLFFALDISTAHEVAHVDLTIEGPFDHVTDKINNAIGSILGSRTPKSQNLEDVIDAAWANGELAHAKNFRQTAAGQTADIFWQKPLNTMAKKYNLRPAFSNAEEKVLRNMNVDLPEVPIIHSIIY